MRRNAGSWRGRLLSLLLIAGTSCIPIEQFDALKEQTENIQKKLDRVEAELQKTREATQMALLRSTCHEDVVNLFQVVATECASGGEYCELSKIPTAIISADVAHHNEGRFITMMSTQPHTAIYFIKVSKDPWLNEFNQDRFTSIMSQRRLMTTKILVVANVDKSKLKDKRQAEAENRQRLRDARERLNVVVQRVRSMHVADESIVTMVFPFSLKPGEKLGKDEAPPPGAIDLYHSVWIFLTECYPNKATS